MQPSSRFYSLLNYPKLYYYCILYFLTIRYEQIRNFEQIYIIIILAKHTLVIIFS